jgi:transposase
MSPTDIKERFIELRAKGYSYEKISKDLGKCKQTLVDWARKYEEEIANLKSMEIEVLNEKYFMQKQRKIEVFGDSLKAIQEELSKRDMREGPTDKLMELFLKYYAFLEAEKIEPNFKTNGEIKTAKKDKESLDRLLGISENVESRLALAQN